MRLALFVPIALVCGLTSARAAPTSTGVLMANTPFQTRYFVHRGAASGPTIVVIGGLHGDEVAGYLAARQLEKWTVRKGTLIVVSDANMPAIRANRRFVGRNMNALFPGNAKGDGNEKLAAALWNLIVASKPDLLLTLHESRGFYAQNPARYGQTFTFDFPTYAARFGRVAEVVNAQIAPGRERFSLKMEAFATCPTFCATKYLGIPATSIETARPLRLETRVSYQLRALRAFFDEWGLEVAPAQPNAGASPAPRAFAEWTSLRRNATRAHRPKRAVWFGCNLNVTQPRRVWRFQ